MELAFMARKGHTTSGGGTPHHPEKYLQRSHQIRSISNSIIIILAESHTFFDLLSISTHRHIFHKEEAKPLSPFVNLLTMGSGCNGVSRRGFPASVEVAGELHVLAVDDSLVDRKVIERLLRISSCKVTAVESGRRALQYLGLVDGEMNSNGQNKLKVNLIITDYSMPGMTGYELMKKIKESSSLSEIPVVIMSSENILARIDRCLEEGAKDYIVKPVKLSDVRRIKDSMVKPSSKENIAAKRGIAAELKSINVSLEDQPKCQSPRCLVRLRRHDRRS